MGVVVKSDNMDQRAPLPDRYIYIVKPGLADWDGLELISIVEHGSPFSTFGLMPRANPARRFACSWKYGFA